MKDKMETVYGIISDLHDDPRIIIPAIKALKNHGAQKIVANGDMGQLEDTLDKTQGRIAFILNQLGESGLECYAQPGSHETVPGFRPVLEFFSEKYDNMFSITKMSLIEEEDHCTVYIPGSDATATGEYMLGNEMDTGFYVRTAKGLIEYETAEERDILASEVQGFLVYQNINDLNGKLKNPGNTIVFCHVPRQFDNLEHAVDVAEFGRVEEDFVADVIRYSDGEIYIGNIMEEKPVKKVTKCQKFSKGAIISKSIAEAIARSGYPVKIVKENVGSEGLKELYEKVGIKKAVSGHIHESGHRATDKNGNPIAQDTFVDELFWNSGHLDARQTGILTVKGGKVSYHNITF